MAGRRQLEDQRLLDGRLSASGPKRLLAIDAVAGRGMITAGLLRVLEERLSRRAGRSVRLCEYYDLIGGVSTGAAAAALLAAGASAEEVGEFFRSIAPAAGATRDSKSVAGRRSRIDLARAGEALAQRFGEARFDTGVLETGFAAFAVQADSGALRIFSPQDPRTPRDMLLRDALTASLGGPAPGEPVMISFGRADGAFEDVGFVDPAAVGFITPALRLLRAATGPSLGLNWPPGDAVLSLMSVGGGAWRSGLAGLTGGKADEAAFARAAAVMSASAQNAAFEAVSAIQAIAETPRPWGPDAAFGDARLTVVPVLHFHRLDAWLDVAALADLGLTYTPAEVAVLREAASDAPSEIARMFEIGKRAAAASLGDPGSDGEGLVLPSRFDPPRFADRNAGAPRIRLQALARAFERRTEES